LNKHLLIKENLNRLLAHFWQSYNANSVTSVSKVALVWLLTQRWCLLSYNCCFPSTKTKTTTNLIRKQKNQSST